MILAKKSKVVKNKMKKIHDVQITSSNEEWMPEIQQAKQKELNNWK